MLNEELRLNEVIMAQLKSSNEKLMNELKEIKHVLKVPRLHFKYLEKLEFEGLVNYRKEYEAVTSTQGNTTTNLNVTSGPLSPHNNNNNNDQESN